MRLRRGDIIRIFNRKKISLLNGRLAMVYDFGYESMMVYTSIGFQTIKKTHGQFVSRIIII